MIVLHANTRMAPALLPQLQPPDSVPVTKPPDAVPVIKYVCHTIRRWFDLVVVLTTDNSILYDRLQGRGYRPEKVQENVQCEIMNVVVEEARSSYRCSDVFSSAVLCCTGHSGLQHMPQHS